jgi:FkbM family methyltransferase
MREQVKASLPLPAVAALKGARSRLRALAWRGRRLGHTLPSGLCVSITSPSDWYVYNEIFVDGEYDEPIDAFVRNSPAGSWALDIGANAGFFTLRLVDAWLRRRGAGEPLKVVCIEGAPATFRVLSRNLAQPALRAVCAPHHGLAGRRSGTASISRSADSGLNSIVDRSASLRRTRVPFVDLTTLVPADTRIRLVKIDIEGAEQLLLDSYRDLLARTDGVVIELHHMLCDTGRCRTSLAEAGLDRNTLLKTFPDACTLELFTRASPRETVNPS